MARLFSLDTTSKDVVSLNNYVIDNIIPVVIKREEEIGKYSMLFFTHQNCDEAELYLELLFETDADTKSEYIESLPIFIENLGDKYKDKLRVFLKCNRIINDNLYLVDFFAEAEEKHKFYYSCTAWRPLEDGIHARKVNIYFNKNIFVFLQLFLTNLLLGKEANIKLALQLIYRICECTLVKVEQVKNDGTTILKDTNFNGLLKEDRKYYASHFTANCGPSEYRFNNITPYFDCKDELKNPLDSSLYIPAYKNDPITIGTFMYNNDFYVVYGDFKDGIVSAVALIFNKDLYENQSFYEVINMFVS